MTHMSNSASSGGANSGAMGAMMVANGSIDSSAMSGNNTPTAGTGSPASTTPTNTGMVMRGSPSSSATAGKRKSMGADMNPKMSKQMKDLSFEINNITNNSGAGGSHTSGTIGVHTSGTTTPTGVVQSTTATNTSEQLVTPASSQMRPPSTAGPQDASEIMVNRLLLENLQIIENIRKNITNHKVSSNINLIAKFRENIILILTCMAKMQGVMRQMPPIPVKLNTICIPIQSPQQLPQSQSAYNVLVQQQHLLQTGSQTPTMQQPPMSQQNFYYSTSNRQQ